jgi:hypothetical protein
MTIVSAKTKARANRILERYNIRVEYGLWGFCHAKPPQNWIYLCTQQSDNDFLTALFHEIQHVLNYRNGKYKTYHNLCKTKKEYLRWALPAERYTDREAAKLAKFHNFHNYDMCYYKPWAKDFIIKVANQIYGED